MLRSPALRLLAFAAIGGMVSVVHAADVVLRTTGSPAVTAGVQLSPGPDSTVSDANRANTGLLQGGDFDNFTFGAADIERLTSGASTTGLLVRQLSASGESFSAGPFTATSSVGIDVQSAAPLPQSWTFDVVPGPGEQPGDRIKIDITVDLAGTLNAFGDNLESSASWRVDTDHGVIVDGNALNENDGTVAFSDENCLSFTIRAGESFTLGAAFSVSASGDSDGPSGGGDASAFFSGGTIDIAATSNFTSIRMITPLEQTRFVSGNASASDPNNGASDSEFSEAVDFTPFQAAAGVNVDWNGVAMGQGGASQDSKIRIFEIDAQGASFASGEAFGFGGEFADGDGQSRFELRFELLGEVEYQFRLYMAAFDSGLASVDLFEENGPVVYSDGAFGETNVVLQGTLPPGIYVLRAYADSSAFGDSFWPGYAFAEFDVQFKIGARFCNSCAGDLNGSGSVDLSDLATLLANFGQAPALPEDGDVDFDGDVDLSDLAALLAAFGVACP